MKKKIILRFLLLIIIIVISFNIFQYFTSNTNSQLLSDLEGTVYYTERIEGVLTLFKSDASLQNKTLIYSHKGKGNDSYGDYNDNIIDFYYDKTSKTIYFIAMNNGSWSLFSLKEKENKPTLLQKEVMETDKGYIQNQFNKLTVSSKKGSLYLLENGNEKTIKKFYGLYDEKFTGYQPIGFSPDGKYLVYHSMEHLTPFGTLLEGFVNNSFGNTYIMDLSTMESAKFIDAYKIQWIID
ncbi:hypothetical protein [Cytobacillus dafuensis]|uniref:Uncharacterized protein n=1 Tax=Cytobacillus dafuensis TaxID=1742359 RepID=A0A5B8Z498_CYTDA|nr:hypothetical protein [Cytobacillus dafuensis]QED47942.1 hypothetical protein FSZ17_12185 [Cytobacillus dafuensis]